MSSELLSVPTVTRRFRPGVRERAATMCVGVDQVIAALDDPEADHAWPADLQPAGQQWRVATRGLIAAVYDLSSSDVVAVAWNRQSHGPWMDPGAVAVTGETIGVRQPGAQPAVCSWCCRTHQTPSDVAACDAIAQMARCTG